MRSKGGRGKTMKKYIFKNIHNYIKDTTTTMTDSTFLFTSESVNEGHPGTYHTFFSDFLQSIHPFPCSVVVIVYLLGYVMCRC